MRCPLCERDCPDSVMEAHHLQTRKKDADDTEDICSLCHKTIHGLFDIKLLRDESLGLDTIEGLMAHPEFSRAVKWIRKQDPASSHRMKSSKNKKQRR